MPRIPAKRGFTVKEIGQAVVIEIPRFSELKKPFVALVNIIVVLFLSTGFATIVAFVGAALANATSVLPIWLVVEAAFAFLSLKIVFWRYPGLFRDQRIRIDSSTIAVQDNEYDRKDITRWFTGSETEHGHVITFHYGDKRVYAAQFLESEAAAELLWDEIDAALSKEW